MAVIKDREGNEWVLQVTTDTLRRVKAEMGVSLLHLMGRGRAATEKLSEPDVMAELLWVLVRDQAQQRGMDRRRFESCWTGKELQEAVPGVLEAVLHFFYPDARQDVLSVRRALEESIRRQRAEGMREVLGESGAGSGDSTSATPPSSESTQAPTPTGS